MPVIKCPCVECKHNIDNTCIAESITLGYRYISTEYEGQKDIWICSKYKLSEEAKIIYDECEKIAKKLRGR